MKREKVPKAFSQGSGKKITRRMAFKGAGAVAGAIALGGMQVGADRASAATGKPQNLLTLPSTVFLLDASRSMFLSGFFPAAGKAALALDALIRRRFSRDILHLVAFSFFAEQIRPSDLAEQIRLSDLPLETWNHTYGANFQHGLMLARQLLARSKAQNRQIILVTDGEEPTAHLEGGAAEFNYPPTQHCLSATLREVECVTRENIVINTFILEPSPRTSSFVDQMSSINRGHALYVAPDHLGEDILAHYVRNRSAEGPRFY